MKQDPVLNFLRENKDRFISGEEISKKLKVSRAAIWKEMQTLRHLGYEIEAQPHLGYRLLGIPDKLFSDEIAYKLKTEIIGKIIYSYEELDSTNNSAFSLGEQGAKEGVCVLSEYQKKGRGRLGRSWASPKGKNILLSILIRPAISPGTASKITLVAAVSIIKTCRKITGETLGIKWPNDIVHQSDKVGGILTEMSAEIDRVNFVVVGIGVNVNSEKKELPPGATSLKEMMGKEISRVEFTRELLRDFEQDYLRFKAGDFENLAREWEDFSATSGRRVMTRVSGRKIQGEALGIDENGALWIRKDNGLQEKITAGDIQHLGFASKKYEKR